MRRESKDDLVATVVLALCTLVLLLPARSRTGIAEIRLAAPGSSVAAPVATMDAAPQAAGLTGAETPASSETKTAPSVPKLRNPRPSAAPVRTHS